jgi:Cu/Ag efflux pump CusA
MGNQPRKLAVWVGTAVGGLVLIGAGLYFLGARQEASPHPQPPPVVVDVATPYPGSGPNEVERQITIPLEAALREVPGQTDVYSKSLEGLSYVRVQFPSNTDYEAASRLVLDRLRAVRGLPAGAAPSINPTRPGWAILWYTLQGPRDDHAANIYTSNDLRGLQDRVLASELHRVPGVAHVSSYGGTVKRYEVRPDPERLRRQGITLGQLEGALRGDEGAAGAGLGPGATLLHLPGAGEPGGGPDPFRQALAAKNPGEATGILRAAEADRFRVIRRRVVVAAGRAPVCVEDVAEGGGEGVAVGHATRRSWAGFSGPGDEADNETVLGVVWLKPDAQDPGQALRDVRARIEELNSTPGKLLPGARVRIFFERPAAGGFPRSAEEDLVWIHGTHLATLLPEDIRDIIPRIRGRLLADREVEAVLSYIGRPEDGTDPSGSHEVELLVRLRGARSAGARAAWIAGMRGELRRHFSNTEWEVTAQEADPLAATFLGRPGEYLLKLFGPDFDELERLEVQVRNALMRVKGVEALPADVLKGAPGLTIRIVPEKCAREGVSVAAAHRVLALAREGQKVAFMREGDRRFPVVLCWPLNWRQEDEPVLDLPVEGTRGTTWHPLRELVVPAVKPFPGDPKGGLLIGSRTVTIYRERGRRVAAIHVRVQDGSPATLLEARQKVRSVVEEPYQAEWVLR